jgi:hypothetical protein
MCKHSHKAWNISPIVLVISLFVFFSGPVNAEVYKCESGKSKVIYSDRPCPPDSTQTVTDIQTNLDINQNGLQSSEKKQSAIMRQLDNAVKSAIAKEDFAHAEALAITGEQQEWIAIAKKEAARSLGTGRTEADLIAELSNSDECRQAKLSLGKEAGSSFHKPDVLAAKTSLMQVSCGLSNEAQPNYADSTYAYGYNPVLFNPYRHYSYRRPGYSLHNPGLMHPVAYTSPPYNRHMEKNFGSRFARPQYKPR